MINNTQKSLLKETFANEPYPSKDTRQKLSEQLGLKKKTVYNWFKWERIRIRNIENRKLQKRKFIHVYVCLHSFVNNCANKFNGTH